METTPEYSYVTDADLFVLRWKRPTVAALLRLTETLRARAERVGGPLFYIALVSVEEDPPDEATRSAILDSVAQTDAFVSSIRLVIVGSGFKATLVRSGMTAMTLASGLRGYPFRVARNVPAALTDYLSVSTQSKREHEQLVELLVRKGIVKTEELG